MYNLIPAADGQVFHEKGRGNGYIVTYGGKRFLLRRRYRRHAGNARPEKHRRGLYSDEPAIPP